CSEYGPRNVIKRPECPFMVLARPARTAGEPACPFGRHRRAVAQGPWQIAARGKAGTGRRVPTCAARGPAPAFPSSTVIGERSDRSDRSDQSDRWTPRRWRSSPWTPTGRAQWPPVAPWREGDFAGGSPAPTGATGPTTLIAPAALQATCRRPAAGPPSATPVA